jgi:hypothetical protein
MVDIEQVLLSHLAGLPHALALAPA